MDILQHQTQVAGRMEGAGGIRSARAARGQGLRVSLQAAARERRTTAPETAVNWASAIGLQASALHVAEKGVESAASKAEARRPQLEAPVYDAARRLCRSSSPACCIRMSRSDTCPFSSLPSTMHRCRK